MKIKWAAFFFLFVITTAFVQIDADFIQVLTKKMQQYKTQSPQVKVFLFFNQSIYAPGDTAYFSAHFLTEDMDRIAGRQIVRVDLIDQNGTLVFFENVALKDGKGANQVAIPTELKAGAYQWVAYSDWMKNFNPEFYFRQDFLLVEKNNLIAGKNDAQVDFKFYPEGGSLVSSVPNKVVIACNTKITSPVTIIDQAGSEVAKLQLNESGRGHFNFTPVLTHSYYATVQHLGKEVRVSLPLATSQGFSIMMSTAQDPFKVDIRTPRESKFRKDNLWLVITSRSEVYFSAPVRFDDRELITVQFPSKELPAGICYATLFNEQGDVLAERLFVGNPSQKIKTTISKNQKTYNTRSGVELQVSLKDDLGNPIQGEFAVSVFFQRLFTNQIPTSTIDQYLQVKADGVDHDYFSAEEPDLLLITQKNKRLDWKTILNGKMEGNHSFKRLIQYSGRVVNKENGQPVPDSSRVVAYLQKSMMGYEAITRKDGSFDLAFLFDFWNDDEIFYTVETKKGKELNAKVIWELDSSSQERFKPMVENETNNSYAEFSKRKKLVDQSYNFYVKPESRTKTIVAQDLNRDFEDELTGVDYSVKVDEYVVFPTMEELIREVVPSLQHRKLRGTSMVRVILPDGAIPNDNPLYIIDGIMTKNTEYFLQLKPSDVISIKVVRTINKLNRFGTMGRNGIVLINTKGLDHKKLKTENTLISVKGLNKEMPFQRPTHNATMDNRIPDFRSTLYWNPLVMTNSRGEGSVSFFASDDVGNFLIQIQGITSDGRPFSQVDSIQVVFNKN